MSPSVDNIKAVLEVLREANKGDGKYPRALNVFQIMLRAKLESVDTVTFVAGALYVAGAVSLRQVDTEGMFILKKGEHVALPPSSLLVQIKKASFDAGVEEVLQNMR